MFHHLRLLLILSIFSVYCLGELVTLTDDDFERQLESNDWLVKFYAPWCTHCRTLKPIFEELGSKVSHAGIAEIDATKSKLAATKYNVTSFPTILYKQDGVVGKYDGARTLEALSFFLERMNSPAYLDINSLVEISDHSTFSDNVTFVLAYNNRREDSAFINQVANVKSEFQGVASKLKQHASFAILPTGDRSLLTNGDISLTKVEPNRVAISMDGAATASAGDIARFVESNNYPLVSRFDNHNFKRLSHIAGKYIVAAVVDYARAEETAAILAALEHAVSPSTLPSPQDQARFIFGHLDGVKWRTFIKHHRTALPAVLLLDQARDLHQTFPLPCITDAKSPDAYMENLRAQVASVVLSMVHNKDMADQQQQWRSSEPPSILEKISYRFHSYYPWSLAVILLPVTFVCMSFFAPYPQEKKFKQH